MPMRPSLRCCRRAFHSPEQPDEEKLRIATSEEAALAEAQATEEALLEEAAAEELVLK